MRTPPTLTSVLIEWVDLIARGDAPDVDDDCERHPSIASGPKDAGAGSGRPRIKPRVETLSGGRFAQASPQQQGNWRFIADGEEPVPCARTRGGHERIHPVRSVRARAS